MSPNRGSNHHRFSEATTANANAPKSHPGSSMENHGKTLNFFKNSTLSLH